MSNFTTANFAREPLPFRDPLLSAMSRRRILLRCQAEWDQRVADAYGRSGRVNHLTVVEGDRAREFAVTQGHKLPYPPELEAALTEARTWARKKSSRPPALAWP